ncbi:MAG: hypothetical protein QOE33_227 [Acidobacteriota bacterium]|nr:hypothetical protein [Acidobacteriota bacterium]
MSGGRAAHRVIQTQEERLSTMRYPTLILNVVIMGTTVGCVLAQAQGTVNKPVRPLTVQTPPSPNVMRVRGVSGAERKRQLIHIEDKPAPLTVAEKSKLTGLAITNLIANAPFTLTPASLVVPNRGSLLFNNVMIIDPDSNPPAAVFTSQADFYQGYIPGDVTDKALMVALDHLTAGKHYLIDYTVKGGDTYYLKIWPGEMKQTFSATTHILVLYEASSAGYAEFALTAQANHHWFFYSAEVTPID